MIARAAVLFLLAFTAWAADPPQTTTPVALPASYLLFPGDRVKIQVYGHPDLDVETRVPADGGFRFPLIGDVPALAGRTASEIAADLSARLADGYLRNPSVTVLVNDFGPRTVWVVGSVQKPGPIQIDPLRATTALQAIGAASGYSDDADRAGAQVVRNDPLHPGAKITLPVPPTMTPDHDVQLQHGDLVVVPRADRVYVLGQVSTPGAFPLPPRETLTVSKAVTLAGGFGRYAKESKVQLVRPGQQPVIVDVGAILDGSGGTDPPLRAGDTVFVPESRF